MQSFCRQDYFILSTEVSGHADRTNPMLTTQVTDRPLQVIPSSYHHEQVLAQKATQKKKKKKKKIHGVS